MTPRKTNGETKAHDEISGRPHPTRLRPIDKKDGFLQVSCANYSSWDETLLFTFGRDAMIIVQRPAGENTIPEVAAV